MVLSCQSFWWSRTELCWLKILEQLSNWIARSRSRSLVLRSWAIKSLVPCMVFIRFCDCRCYLRYYADMTQAMGSMMHFMTTEKKTNYENSCFFISIFGLGPAWTMYVFEFAVSSVRWLLFHRYLLGFFLPVLWFFGLFYIASAVSVKKTAGAVHFVTLVLYCVYPFRF